MAHVGHPPERGEVCGEAEPGEDGRQPADVATVHDVRLAAVRLGVVIRAVIARLLLPEGGGGGG